MLLIRSITGNAILYISILSFHDTVRDPTPVLTPNDPCYPSPCGPYSQCQADGQQSRCTCLPNYIGAAPNCRPECTINAECPHDRACVNRRCVNPCAAGTCGNDAECFVVRHTANCVCPSGQTGDPFVGCRRVVQDSELFCSLRDF